MKDATAFVSIAAAVVALASCGSSPEAAVPEDMRIEVGKPFPDLLLPTLADGRPASLASFRGKKTLLHIFASW